MFVAYKPKVNTDSKILSLQPHLVISRLVDESTYVEHHYTNLLTFLLTKYFSDYDNFFFKRFFLLEICYVFNLQPHLSMSSKYL
jgi:hypothetical protein